MRSRPGREPPEGLLRSRPRVGIGVAYGPYEMSAVLGPAEPAARRCASASDAADSRTKYAI
ncbi:hypothetical protein [Streptomyces sp. NPDC057257]|uniref:hypothetical protein n=1 Tax=Streptomyces sp. NPDC057257 TaxID=3346071 RepID=UPI00363545E8